MSLTLSYDTEPAAGIFCCFDCSRASLAMHTDAASLSDFVTLLQFVTVDESRPCLAAFHTKNEQAHLWILIYVCMHIPQTSAAISGLLVAVWVPARQILHRNIVWGPRAGIITFLSKHEVGKGAQGPIFTPLAARRRTGVSPL